MADAPRGLRAFWRLNRGMRLLALLLAVIVWYAIREATSFEATVEDVPITILHDGGMALLDVTPQSTDVRFAGARADIRDITRNQTQVIVDVRGRSVEGPQSAPMDVSSVRAPRGCRPVFVRAERVSFSLDRETEKAVPVKVEVRGEPPQGFELERILSVPATVQVRGPSSQVRRLESLRTEIVDLDGRPQSFQVERAIVLPQEARSVRVVPDRVKVEAVVVEHSATRTLERARVRVLSGAEDRWSAAVTPALVTVVVQGRVEVLNALAVDAVQPFVDVSDLPLRARYELPVRIFIAVPVRVVSVEPSAVTVDLGEGSRP